MSLTRLCTIVFSSLFLLIFMAQVSQAAAIHLSEKEPGPFIDSALEEPTHLMVVQGSSSVILKWRKPKDINISRVKIWRSDKKCTRGTSIASISLKGSDSYQYTDRPPGDMELFYIVSSITDQDKESRKVLQWSTKTNKAVSYLSPFSQNDKDCDGLTDTLERLYRSDPNNPDTDRDLFLDGLEVETGYDPRSGNGKRLSKDSGLALRLKGKIILAPELNGESFYLNPDTLKAHYLGRPADAWKIMKTLGVGIKRTDLAKIPKASVGVKGDAGLKKRLAGKIIIDVEAKGEAWYVHPETLERHFLGRPHDAFAVMKSLSIGISNEQLVKLDLYY